MIVANRFAAVTAVAVLSAAVPASAHNLIVNGSFETGDFSDFNLDVTHEASPATVIGYNDAAAFGEAVPVDDAMSADTEAAGASGVYFGGNVANAAALTQMTALHAGNYEIGFDVYVPASGARNANDATLTGSIIGVDVAHFAASQVAATHWYNISGVATVAKGGWYQTSFAYNAFGLPAKDFVIDKVFVQSTAKAATYAIPPTPMAALPEPETWMLMLSGFAFVGTFARRRRPLAVAG